MLTCAKKLVTPSKRLEDEKKKIATEVFDLVSKECDSYKEIKEVEFGGSYPKGTWLPEKADIDIFIKFDKAVPGDRFVRISHNVGFTALKKYKPYVRYSEHPYVEASVRDTIVNVVPCYIVKKGQWQSAADRSQYHTEFMRKNLSTAMKEDVRLLKRFLKTNGIYGAEISKQGLSGYVAEVLIWYYGSFENVISQIAKIKEGQVIGKTSKQFDTPITIIDPIDPQRNLAAAISTENIGKFILLCRAFKKKPSTSFFKNSRKKTNPTILKNCLTIRFQFKKRSPDIIWGQIKRATNSIAVQLQLGGFKVIKSDAITDEKNVACLFFLLESIDISKNYVKDGPEFFNEKDVIRFISKNEKHSKLLWIGKDKKIHSLSLRSINNAKKFVKYLLSTSIDSSGVPKGIKDDIRKGFRITVGEDGLGKSIKRAIREIFSTDAAIFSTN